MAAPTQSRHPRGVLGPHLDVLGQPPRSTARITHGRVRLSPSLPLRPCLQQQRRGVERRLRHRTDVLFPASPSFFQAAPPSPPAIPHCTDEPWHILPGKPNVLSARDAAGGQLHAGVIPSVISFFPGSKRSNYSAPWPRSRAR